MPFSLLVSGFSPLSPQFFPRKKTNIPVENHMVNFSVRATFGLSFNRYRGCRESDQKQVFKSIAMNPFFSSRGVTDNPAAISLLRSEPAAIVG